MKVLITDHVYPSLDFERDKLKALGAELIQSPGSGEEVLVKAVQGVDLVIVCFAEITEKVIAAMDKCKGICRTGIGVNNINIPAATKKGILVTNVPDYCIEEVSDHALSLILALARKVVLLDRTVQGGIWSIEKSRPLYRLRGKTLGILGFGRIGRLLAEKVKPFELKILAYDPYVNAESMSKAGVTKSELADIFKEADYISLHLPLTPETENIINTQNLGLMKRSACIINVSRGPLIDETALYEALKAGAIAGAGLDVLKSEKYNPANPLFTLDNIIITPHAAFYSEESTQELREKSLRDAISILEGKTPVYLLNPEAKK